MRLKVRDLCVFMALAGLVCELGAVRYIEDPESFPGWKGELPASSIDTSPTLTPAPRNGSGGGRALEHMV
jgi:hypothetical protein